jgi:hypothetical protein
MTDDPKTNSAFGQAICAVMAALKRLEKKDRNKFASYDFTSVDDFKDELRPLFAKNGLWLEVKEIDFQFMELKDDKDKTRHVVKFKFEIRLRHVSGEKGARQPITIALPYTGAQTSGAARSYAVKEWCKSGVMASSGDTQEEADLLDNSRENLRLSRADGRPLYTEMEKGLRESEKSADYTAVASWWQDNKEKLEMLPKDWFLEIKGKYADAYKSLKAQADLDEMSNEELDKLAANRELAQHPLNAG